MILTKDTAQNISSILTETADEVERLTKELEATKYELRKAESELSAYKVIVCRHRRAALGRGDLLTLHEIDKDLDRIHNPSSANQA